MALFALQRKSGGLVKVTCGIEAPVRPQHDLAIADGARERDAFVDQAPPDPEASRRRLDEQKPQLCDARRSADQKNRADVLPIALGDPATLALAIETLQKLCGD